MLGQTWIYGPILREDELQLLQVLEDGPRLKRRSLSLALFGVLNHRSFGFVYLAEPEKKGGFAACGCNPHIGVRRALEALGYRYEFRWFQDEDEALTYLHSALEQGPIILGPIDMGYLTYSPFRRFQAGLDHYLVLTHVDGEVPMVDDPDGFLQVLLLLKDILKACEGRDLGKEIMYQGAGAIERLAEDIGRYRFIPLVELLCDLLFQGLRPTLLRQRPVHRGGPFHK